MEGRVAVVIVRSDVSVTPHLSLEAETFVATSVRVDGAVIHKILQAQPDVVILSGLKRDRRDGLVRNLHSEGRTAHLPILSLDETELPNDTCSDAYDSLHGLATREEIEGKILSLASRRGRLHTLIQRFDLTAVRLVDKAGCEWVRCRTGIIGLVAVPHKSTATTLKGEIRQRVVDAHSCLEALPETELTTEDLWNLLLFVSVAWHNAEAKEDGSEQALLEVQRDLTGSRKIVLWRGVSPVEHIGPLIRTQRGTVATPSEPAREAIEASTDSGTERLALRALLKKRILAEDVDRIIEVLGETRNE